MQLALFCLSIAAALVTAYRLFAVLTDDALRVAVASRFVRPEGLELTSLGRLGVRAGRAAAVALAVVAVVVTWPQSEPDPFQQQDEVGAELAVLEGKPAEDVTDVLESFDEGSDWRVFEVDRTPRTTASQTITSHQLVQESPFSALCVGVVVVTETDVVDFVSVHDGFC